jgi:spermidine/putrescine transport system ATP-binding protein
MVPPSVAAAEPHAPSAPAVTAEASDAPDVGGARMSQSLPETILRLVGVTRRFGDVVAVDGIDLEILAGEFFTIVGPSGSGKTTLLRMLAGFEPLTAGEIRLRGQDMARVPCNRRPTCMVFQSLALFSHMTVGQNIEYSQKVRGIGRAARRQKCLDLMKTVRLSPDFYARPVGQCSGGERQRVAIARALALDPEILFFDEPLSAIDYRLRKTLEMELKDLQRETGKTFVYITHSLEEAMVMSDRIGIMKNGGLVQVGTPDEIYDRPVSRFVAQFMGEVNTFEVTSLGGGRYRCLSPEMTFAGPVSPVASGSAGFLVVRPEKLRLLEATDRADNVLTGRVLNEYVLGSRVQMHLESAGRTCLVEEIRGSRRAPGQPVVHFGWDAADGIFVNL